MTVTGVTLAGRTAALGLMADACTVGRSTQETAVVNENSGQLIPNPTTAIYSGQCRVKPLPASNRQVEIGERRIVLQFFIISLPMTAISVAVDDIVTITASALDGALVGRTLRVLDVERGSQITARRLLCEETVQ